MVTGRGRDRALGPCHLPCTGHDTSSELKSISREGRDNAKDVVQSAQLRNLNVNGVGFFASLKSHIPKEGYGAIDKTVESTRAMFA